MKPKNIKKEVYNLKLNVKISMGNLLYFSVLYDRIVMINSSINEYRSC